MEVFFYLSYFYEFLDFKEKIKDPVHPVQVPKKTQEGYNGPADSDQKEFPAPWVCITGGEIKQ